MREIKFRVWDDKLKVIFSPDNQNTNGLLRRKLTNEN